MPRTEYIIKIADHIHPSEEAKTFYNKLSKELEKWRYDNLSIFANDYYACALNQSQVLFLCTGELENLYVLPYRDFKTIDMFNNVDLPKKMRDKLKHFDPSVDFPLPRVHHLMDEESALFYEYKEIILSQEDGITHLQRPPELIGHRIRFIPYVPDAKRIADDDAEIRAAINRRTTSEGLPQRRRRE